MSEHRNARDVRSNPNDVMYLINQVVVVVVVVVEVAQVDVQQDSKFVKHRTVVGS